MVKRLSILFVVLMLLLVGCVKVSVENKEATPTTVVCPCTQVIACPLVETEKEVVVVKEVIVKEIVKEVVKEPPATIIVQEKIHIHNNIHPKVDVKINQHNKNSNKK